MINPKDIEAMDTDEGRSNLPQAFVEEFTDNKGKDDDNGSDSNVQQ